MEHQKSGRLAELFRYRDLIYMLVVRDLKTRYKGSFLGFLWTLLNPLLMFGVFYIVFSVIARVEAPHYALQLLLGIMFWNIISETANTSIYTIIGSSSLIKKIYLPAEVFPLSVALGVAVNFCFSLPVLLLFFILQGVPLGLNLLYLVPGFILIMLLATGVGLAVSSIAVYLKDTNHFVPVLVTIAFWGSAVLYPLGYALDRVGKPWSFLFLLNPFAVWLTFVRSHLIPGAAYTIPGPYLGISVLVIFLALIGGWTIFSRLRVKFAEYL